jgi:hypothetical protein
VHGLELVDPDAVGWRGGALVSESAIQREEWRPVVGYEGRYEVSSWGRVRSIDRYVEHNSRWGLQRRIVNGRMLRLRIINGGYYCICAWKDGKPRYPHVAHMVAEAFIGPRPRGNIQVCHNDGNPKNNAVGNLRYDTIKNNHADKRKHGTAVFGQKTYNAQLTDDLVKQIRAHRGRKPLSQLARELGISYPALIQARRGYTWRHV